MTMPRVATNPVPITLPPPVPDGLLVDEVGSWALEKYRRLALYDTLFASGMKRRWDVRVYLDLFCGPGRASIRSTGPLIETSPLIALRVPTPFDAYIFCDERPDAIAALRARVAREFPEAHATYLVGNCHAQLDAILAAIPKASRTRTVLSLCVLDPYGIGDLKFRTIRALSRFRMDFLMLLALAMDANRFQPLYVRDQNPTIDAFLGDRHWRAAWQVVRPRGVSFRRFLAEHFARQMTALGYLPTGLDTMVEVRSDERNLPLYHLAFFSKHVQGYQFWKADRRYGTDQLSLFE
jgi:three-Cys-motif partner protein